MRKKIIALGILALVSATNMVSFADTTNNEYNRDVERAQYSIVNANNVNLRKTPSTSGTIIRQLHKGYRVLEYSEPTVSANGYIWQKVSYNGSVGWVAINYLTSLG